MSMDICLEHNRLFTLESADTGLPDLTQNQEQWPSFIEQRYQLPWSIS